MSNNINDNQINFAQDLRIFAPRIVENIRDIVTQVAIVEARLPTMEVGPSMAEARDHLLEVAAHLNSEISYAGGWLEIHSLSVVSRAMRLANAFACEDIRSERQGGPMILDGNQWRDVHRAIINGCAGTRPSIRRNGTLRPPRWAVDLLELTGRLAEVGWGPEEVRLKARALSEPSPDERRAATEMAKMMIRRKDEFICTDPRAAAAAGDWLRCNQRFFSARPRPEGALDIDGMVWVRLSFGYRVPTESAAAARERSYHLAQESTKKVLVIGSRSGTPVRVDREVAEIVRGNTRSGREYARNARRSA